MTKDDAIKVLGIVATLKCHISICSLMVQFIILFGFEQAAAEIYTKRMALGTEQSEQMNDLFQKIAGATRNTGRT